MPHLDTHRFDHLTEDKVLCRIADLLATAIRRDQVLSSSRKVDTRSSPVESAKPVDPTTLIKDPQERAMARYLTLTGSASPKDFRMALGLARRTVSRKLARLCATGLCEATGRTKAVRYQLRTDHSRN
jgi:predicted HTH transcriptional regulator